MHKEMSVIFSEYLNIKIELYHKWFLKNEQKYIK